MRHFGARHGNGRLQQAALLAAGSLVGAGIALLLAPQSGKQTRKSLVRMGDAAQKGVRNFQSNLNSKMDHFFTDVRHDLKSCVNDGRVWTEDKRDELERALKVGKRQIEKEISRVLHS